MSRSREVDRALSRWLSTHYSVIARYEAFELGAGPSDIRTRSERGEWLRMSAGVYRVASAPRSPYQSIRGAFVAKRGLAVVSHLSAAWLWQLLKRPSERPELTVSMGRDNRTSGPWRLHRSGDFYSIQAVARATVLVTNPLRTLVDLAATVGPATLTEAADAAIARQLVSVTGLLAEVDRLSRPGRGGVAILRRHLKARGFTDAPAPSVLEAEMRRLIAGSDLPLPQVELGVEAGGRYRIDLAWPEVLLAVEVDGYTWHFSPEHMKRDNLRRNRLRAGGWQVLVYTWLDIRKEPNRVVGEVAGAFRDAAASG